MKKRIFFRELAAVIIVLAFAEALSGCSSPTSDSAARANSAVIREAIDLINDRNLDEAFDLYAIDYVYHGPGGQELRGREAIRDLWDVFLTGFPDVSASIDDIVYRGDKVAMRWTLTGTHRGEFLGVAPTGNRMTLSITEIFRFEDGRLAEAWDQYDRLHLMQQIGEFTDD